MCLHSLTGVNKKKNPQDHVKRKFNMVSRQKINAIFTMAIKRMLREVRYIHRYGDGSKGKMPCFKNSNAAIVKAKNT